MDFHRHQSQARAQSARLVLLFVLAVGFVLVGVNAVGAFVWGLVLPGVGLPDHFIVTNSTVVLLYVLGGAWLEWQRLDGGGSAVALRLGANPPAQYNVRHKRLVNIVEELAIAAGIPVPEVFVIEHDSINAMVAGHDQAHCALIVTRGALERFTRDELAGVIAHEYAHIVNGDMALNTRLAGALYGLHSLSMLGRTMLRSVLYIRRRDRAPMVAPWPLLLFGGVVLTSVGSLGALAARLVQSAVSRQREFLADAHAVQFVRDVNGLGRALRKIAGQQTTPMRSEYNEVVAHLWLSSVGIGRDWFDTHPALDVRVKRLYGRSMGAIRPERVELENSVTATRHPLGAGVPDIYAVADPSVGSDVGGRMPALGLVAMATIGSDTAPAPEPFQRTDPVLMRAAFEAVEAARDGASEAVATAGILIAAARDPVCNLSRAALLLNAIVAGPIACGIDELDPGPDARLHQALQWLEQPQAQWLRVPLIEILTGRVRHWPVECRRTLVRYCNDAVLADGRIEKTEWIYYTLVRHRLLHDVEPGRVHVSANEKRRALAEIFSMAAHLSDQSARRVREAVVAAATAIGVEQPTATPDGFEFRSLTRALDVLRCVPPLRKPVLLTSLRDLARDDASPVYQAFLVAVAAAIDCPPLRIARDGVPSRANWRASCGPATHGD